MDLTNSNSTIDETTQWATCELSAFYSAVAEEYGLDQAFRSAEDWLYELDCLMLRSPDSAPDFRKVTISASARLAERLGWAEAFIAGCVQEVDPIARE